MKHSPTKSEDFHPVLYEAFALLAEEQKPKATDEIVFSHRFKRKINRLFREQVGIPDACIPHPEEDTVYERLRSRVIRFFSRPLPLKKHSG